MNILSPGHQIVVYFFNAGKDGSLLSDVFHPVARNGAIVFGSPLKDI